MLKALWPRSVSALRGHPDGGRRGRGVLQQVFRRKALESVFLFVTSRCNSSCRTCFYSNELNRDDLTPAQMIRLSETAPIFEKLWISGGEPFLCKGLVEIIAAFYRNNKIEVVNLPTNGLLPERIVRETGRLLELCPDLKVNLSFSIDGFSRSNDSLRGVPGGFKRTITAMERVSSAFDRHAKLQMNAVTVLTPENFDELIDLSRYLLKRFPMLGYHLWHPARGKVPDPRVQDLSRADVARMHERFRPIIDTICQRLFGQLQQPQRFLAEIGFAGSIALIYKLTEACFTEPSSWGMSCPAGNTSIVIDADGSFRACELRGRIGHLRDYEFDLGAALRSPAMQAEIAAIGGGARANCWCTHGCWQSSALKFAPLTLLTRLPLAYLEHKHRSPGPIAMDSIDIAALEARYPLAPQVEGLSWTGPGPRPRERR